MMISEIAYWLALSDRKGIISPQKVEMFLSENHSIGQLWNAGLDDLRKIGLSDIAIANFVRYRKSLDLNINYQKIIALVEKGEVKIIRYVDMEYPPLLKTASDDIHTLQDPPLILFHKGSLVKLTDCVGIVGTRECSHYGHMMARKLGRDIARLGYTVVSGLARGIDTEAQCGALEVAKGKTISVLAWMDPIYPPENSQLSKDIAKRGALISERFAPGLKFNNTRAPGNFVDRNRIISGISRCIIAVESGIDGGTIHQVKIASAQGRKVFTVEPQKENKRAIEGFRLLTDMGAEPIKSVAPIKKFLNDTQPESFREKKIDDFYQNRF